MNRANIFETGYNAAWPFRDEPSSGHAVPTAAGYSAREQLYDHWYIIRADNVQFSGSFAKLRTATTTFVMSVRLSVCPHGKIRLPLDGFS